jgi:hypothetical protein
MVSDWPNVRVPIVSGTGAFSVLVLTQFFVHVAHYCVKIADWRLTVVVHPGLCSAFIVKAGRGAKFNAFFQFILV